MKKQGIIFRTGGKKVSQKVFIENLKKIAISKANDKLEEKDNKSEEKF
ncbi:hypothetical protein [Chryseobacterium terrae]|uniref:Uncharacterized protein n=1 Tax=Chryseobacterium terrae TaxID=3163299 RepID=A0ABW8Y399_9FLAO